jgi:hypothetical protein
MLAQMCTTHLPFSRKKEKREKMNWNNKFEVYDSAGVGDVLYWFYEL